MNSINKFSHKRERRILHFSDDDFYVFARRFPRNMMNSLGVSSILVYFKQIHFGRFPRSFPKLHASFNWWRKYLTCKMNFIKHRKQISKFQDSSLTKCFKMWRPHIIEAKTFPRSYVYVNSFSLATEKKPVGWCLMRNIFVFLDWLLLADDENVAKKSLTMR